MAYTNLPPNLYDYFSKLNQRIRKLESAPDQAMDTATTASAQAINASTQATNAEAQAVQALAQATTAYSTASQAIIKSSNTIVNAYNQLTAINGSGITVYSGASSTSGARVVLNSAGLAGFNSSGTATFSLSASDGSLSLTGASFTNGTIYGGSLNINGNCIINSSGFLTATGATITGVITATSGSFTGSIYSSSGTIGGWSINTNGIYNGSYEVYSNGAFYLNTGTFASSVVFAGNITVNTGTTTNIGGSLTLTGLGTFNGGLTSNGTTTVNGTFSVGSSYTGTFNNYLYNPGRATTTSSANVYMNATSGLFALVTSSQRYKVEIEPQDIPVQSIMALVPKSYVDKVEYENNNNSDTGLPRYLGLIAEDLAELPVIKDLLVNYNEEGQPDSVNYDRIAVALVPLLQNVNTRLTALEGKVNGNTN